MALTELKKKSNKKWNDANMKIRYDRVQLVIPKGQKDILKAHAAARGESLNGFVNRCIDEGIARDNVTHTTTTSTIQQLKTMLELAKDEPIFDEPKRTQTAAPTPTTWEDLA